MKNFLLDLGKKIRDNVDDFYKKPDRGKPFIFLKPIAHFQAKDQ